MRALFLALLFMPGLLKARNWSIALGGGWGAPLSPRGADSFATAHKASLGTPDARVMRHWGSWGLGIEGAEFLFQRQDARGTVELNAEALALEWDYQYSEDAKDHVYGLLSAGYAQAFANAPLIERSWRAGAGALTLGYEFPLFSSFSFCGEASGWGFLGPDGFDGLITGTLRGLIRTSF